MAHATTSEPFLAAGFMSMPDSSFRRVNARHGIQSTIISSVVARFLIAISPGAMPPSNVLQEAEEHGDIAWLNMTEGSPRCSLKYLLWMKMAPELFPSIRYVVLADDDVFVQLGHLEADLQIVHGRSNQERYILYGLFQWRAFYNHVQMLPNTGFNGWINTDKRAVAVRRTIDRCMAEMAASGASNVTDFSDKDAKRARSDGRHPYCGRLQLSHVRAVGSHQVDSLGPFPMVNGPCFAVSTPLAAALVADRYPREWLTNLSATPTARVRMFGYPCWPVGDSVVGLWVTQVALRRALPLELVNSPFLHQHFPWPRWRPKAGVLAFGNGSIVLHGLKGRSHNRTLSYAIQASAGPFEPFVRSCDSCGSMGWSTYANWSSSSSSARAMREWTCCGRRETPGWLLRPCQSRSKKRCPKFFFEWDEIKAFCSQKISHFRQCVRILVGSKMIKSEAVPKDLLPATAPRVGRRLMASPSEADDLVALYAVQIASAVRSLGKLPTVVDPTRMKWTVALSFAALLAPGDFVEAGVFKGGSSIAMMRVLDSAGDARRHWACDSFQGVPKPTTEDKTGAFDYVGRACGTALTTPAARGRTTAACSRPRGARTGLWKSSRTQFEENVRKYNVTASRLRIVEGWYRDTLPPRGLHSIAFLRLDGDLYNSTRDSLERLEPLVASGGYICACLRLIPYAHQKPQSQHPALTCCGSRLACTDIDDYGTFRGCAAAVDEYRAARAQTEQLHPIVAGARGKFQALWWRKS